MSRVAGRVEDFGLIGSFLEKHLVQENVNDLLCASTNSQWETVSSLQMTDYMEAISTSILVCNYPYHIHFNFGLLKYILYNSFYVAESFYAKGDFNQPQRDLVGSRVIKGVFRGLFPPKPFDQAEVKANLHVTGVLCDLKIESERMFVDACAVLADSGGAYEDQAVSIVLYGCTLAHWGWREPFRLARFLVMNPKEAKALSCLLKGLGWNGVQEGAVLCEANVLAGRGVGTVDLEHEASYRCKADEVRAGTYNPDEATLRLAIRAVLTEEIDRNHLVYEDEETWWSRRWLWCANGSHNRTAEAHATGVDSIIPDIVQRPTRQNFVAAKDKCSVGQWNGRVVATASTKYEHGKTRALFSCDTASYIAFERVLRPVEKAWRGVSAVLSPGEVGNYGMCERVRDMRSSGGVSVMLDYDDFNSQHSTRSMQMLFDELFLYIQEDCGLKERIISFFENTWLYYKGRCYGQSSGTLMSGHRATSFVNTVLNRAYLLVAYPELNKLRSIHVGDDVFIAAPDSGVAAAVLDAVGASGVRMNPTKQSIGRGVSEFLRMAIGADGTYGYVARSIASIISGNWVSEKRLSLDEAMNSLVNSSWSMINRGSGEKAVGCIVSAVLAHFSIEERVDEDYEAAVNRVVRDAKLDVSAIPAHLRDILFVGDIMDDVRHAQHAQNSLTIPQNRKLVAAVCNAGKAQLSDEVMAALAAKISPDDPQVALSCLVECRRLSKRYLSKSGLVLSSTGGGDKLSARRWLRDALTGVVGFREGPARQSSFVEMKIDLEPVGRRLSEPLKDKLVGLPQHSVDAYLREHVSRVEREAIASSSVDIVSKMKEAVYSKSFESAELHTPSWRMVSKRMWLFRQDQKSVSSSEIQRRPEEGGVLGRYPLLAFVKHALDKETLRDLVMIAGGDSRASDIRKEAWGPGTRGMVVVGSCVRSDAMSWSRRGTEMFLHMTWNMFF